MSTFPRRLVPIFLLAPIALAGCDTHPLPNDVTGLPIFEIVHRIECEAADEVRAKHPARGSPGRLHALEVLDKEIADKTEKLKSLLADIKSHSDYGTTQLELEDAFDSINLQIDQVLQKISKLKSEPQTPHGNNQLETLRNEAVQLFGQYKRLIIIADNFRETTSKTEKLKELTKSRDAYADIIAFEGNNAAFQFVFQVTENNNASSTGTITWPITPGIITLGYGIGDKRKRASDRQVKLVASFGELNKLKCSDIEVPEERRFPRMYPITGEIGLAEVISDYLSVANRKGQKFLISASGDSYRDKITFTTVINGSLTPGINLSKRMGQLIQASAELMADRTDVHELTIFLTPPGAPATAGGAQEIIIRQMPAVRVRARSVEQSPAG